MNDFSDEANHQRRVALGYAYSCAFADQPEFPVQDYLDTVEPCSVRGLAEPVYEFRAMKNKRAFARCRRDSSTAYMYYICILEPDEDEDLHKLVPHLRRQDVAGNTHQQ